MQQFLLLAVLIATSACAQFDRRRPNIELGTVDYPRMQAIMVEWNRPNPPVVRKVPLEFADKFVILSPANWESLQNYIDRLEESAK